MRFDPLNPSIPFGDWVEAWIDWLQTYFGWFFDGVEAVLSTVYEALVFVLATPPYWIIILVFAAIAWWLRSWRLAVFTVIGFYVIRSFDLWVHAMETIALVLVAVICALVLSIPLGIWAARSETVSKILKPILDLMQTMPAMVYLIPAITIFGIGPMPGAIATLVFAMPPGVRLTELGIRQVDKELVEAGYAFGSPRRRILTEIQIPVALPTIMAGVNQVIMLALSMVVLAGMAGAGGLGGDVVGSLSSLNVPLGIEAGTAVVIIAIYLDRVSAAFGDTRRIRRRPSRSSGEGKNGSPGRAATESPDTAMNVSVQSDRRSA